MNPKERKLIVQMLRVLGRAFTKAGDKRLPRTIDDMSPQHVIAWTALAKWVLKRQRK